MLRKILLGISFGLFALSGAAGKMKIEHVHPLHWWAGMSNPELQVLIHGEGIGDSEVALTASDVTINRIVRPESKNYIILYLDTKNAKAQKFDIVLNSKKAKSRIPYELKSRSGRKIASFDASDVVYLLMPDRFASGNANTDVVPGLKENKVDREDLYARHGGDIAGIVAHLDYLNDLGVTAIWHTPMHVNDMPEGSYHGYAITDYYQMDPRFGTNEEYRTMVEQAHAKGIKVIMDLVFNHCGSCNFLFEDRPANDWFNFNSEYVQTNYRIASVSDTHASNIDKSLAQDGWFVKAMPDLNQKNPDVMRYLIQTSLWWIEYAGIDGIRQDTYPYADLEAMATWCKEVEQEYPGFNIVGETWINHNVGVSYWQKDSKLAAPRNTMLPTVMDFPLMYLLNSTVDEETDDWDKGFARIYEYLSQDIVYADPMHLLTFLDNHDTSRFAKNEKEAENTDRYKQALTLLLTLRGIPQLYYGDEIGMYGDKGNGDGALRRDFPGGWPNDERTAFTEEGRTELENAIHAFTRRLLQWRKGNEAVGKGTLTQFAVKNGVYAYARSYNGRKVLVLLNGTSKPVSVDMRHYSEAIPKSVAYEVLSSSKQEIADSLEIEPHGIRVFDFQ